MREPMVVEARQGKARRMSRRRFLIASGGILAVSMAACGGTLSLMTASTGANNFGATQCGKESKMQKVLVAYASRSGSTAEVAQAVAGELCKQGAQADVRSVEQVGDLSAYDAVVVGSAIRMGQWLPAAVDFVKKNQAALQQKPLAYFTVHMLNVDDSEESRKQRAAYVEPVHALATPDAEAFFAGIIDPKRLSLFEKMMVKMVHSPEGDFRDWTKIRGWADGLLASEGMKA